MKLNASHLPQVSYSVNDAVRATGFSRSRIYKFIGAGYLETFKVGKRTFISHSALSSLVAKAETGAFSECE